MTLLGIPVPAGFTITTEACRAYMSERQPPDGLEQEVREQVRRLEEKAGKRFGDPDDPLLVSVRSGAAVSMPGMMDTILNVGLSDGAAAGLATTTGNARFAYDSYRRLIQMYGETVDGVDPHRFEQELQRLKRERGVSHDVELTAEDLAGLVATFLAIYEQDTGKPFPQDANEQLIRAVEAVFDSWETPRAQVYRRAHDIPDDLGTAVNIVQMVFGNKGERSGTGVAFTRDPSTGEPVPFGEFLVDAQGEDVVAGIRTPQPLDSMREQLPAAYDELLETIARLEAHYRDMQDIEFTVEDDRLYLLQTRTAKRTAAASLKAAVDMDGEGVITPRGGRGADRSRTARPAAPPDDRPHGGGRGRRHGPERLPGRRLRKIVFDAGRAEELGEGEKRDPRPLGDDAGRHPRPDPRPRGAHGARWDDLARRRRRTGHGQAVRGRVRRARHRR